MWDTDVRMECTSSSVVCFGTQIYALEVMPEQLETFSRGQLIPVLMPGFEALQKECVAPVWR